MAEIKGITFSNQAVTPKDDGQLRAHILSDGIISGCTMAYSAATFSLSPGMLIAAGRCMRIPTTVYKAVDQATSGYARVLLTIDLTATATTSEFEQAQLSVEYSSTMGGFPSLVQGDINGSGTTYQIVLAVMTLGTGGISGIVSTLPVSHAGADAALLSAGKVKPEQASAAVGYIGEAMTLGPIHAGKFFRVGAATAVTITIGAESDGAWPADTEIELCQWGIGAVTIAGASGVSVESLDGAKTIAGQFGCVCLKRITDNYWLLAGALA